MKLIVLGGGSLQVNKIKITKGLTPLQFTESNPYGEEILAKLKERTNNITWSQVLGYGEYADVIWEMSRTFRQRVNWMLTN